MTKYTYSRSTSTGIRRGTCCKSRCEQSTVWPVHVHTRGHFWSTLLYPILVLPPIFVLAKFVPWMKMPTLPTLLCEPNDVSPFPYGINCNSNSKITKLLIVAVTTQLSGGFFIFDIISHIWLFGLLNFFIWHKEFWFCDSLNKQWNVFKVFASNLMTFCFPSIRSTVYINSSFIKSGFLWLFLNANKITNWQSQNKSLVCY